MPIVKDNRRSQPQGIVQPVEPTDDAIRARAYEIYQARGSQGGSPEQDWEQARAELRGQRNRIATPPTV